jgi:hypothetical protein
LAESAQGKGSGVAPTTYILPDLPWAVLLGPITHDARPGDVIVVYTDAMREHVEQVVRAAGRDDLIVQQQDPPPAQGWF